MDKYKWRTLISSISDFPDNTFGFIYRVVHKPTGKALYW